MSRFLMLPQQEHINKPVPHRLRCSSVFVISARAKRNAELFALVSVIVLWASAGRLTLGDLS